MKIWMVTVVAAALLLSACTFNARLYPVQGPLSQQSPVPVFAVKFSGAFNSGSITTVLGGGEVCTGRWQVVRKEKIASGAAETLAPDEKHMAEAWDLLYGSGFYVAHVLGARLRAGSVLKGTQNTILTVEMYRPEGQSDENNISAIKGVAKDNAGNIYKLVIN